LKVLIEFVNKLAVLVMKDVKEITRKYYIVVIPQIVKLNGILNVIFNLKAEIDTLCSVNMLLHTNYTTISAAVFIASGFGRPTLGIYI
jgi:hypothetical protein